MKNLKNADDKSIFLCRQVILNCGNATHRFLHVSINFINTFMVMVFDATINNISVISWQSVLLVEETGVPRENHPPVASH